MWLSFSCFPLFRTESDPVEGIDAVDYLRGEKDRVVLLLLHLRLHDYYVAVWK